MDPERAIKAVFSVIQRHVAEAETAKVRHALPEDIRMLWPPNAGVHRVKHGDGSMKVADVMTRNVQLTSPRSPSGWRKRMSASCLSARMIVWSE